MKKTEGEKVGELFGSALLWLVQECYCIGAASEDEIRHACADFLFNQAMRFMVEIPRDTQCPSRR